MQNLVPILALRLSSEWSTNPLVDYLWSPHISSHRKRSCWTPRPQTRFRYTWRASVAETYILTLGHFEWQSSPGTLFLSVGDNMGLKENRGGRGSFILWSGLWQERVCFQGFIPVWREKGKKEKNKKKKRRRKNNFPICKVRKKLNFFHFVYGREDWS